MATRSSTANKSAALDPALPQKKRARRRLVGAAAVCLAAAVVLPLIFDSEPRQLRDDVQVSIPSRDTPLNDRDAAPSHNAAGPITPYAGQSAGAPRPLGEASEQLAQADDGKAKDDPAESNGTQAGEPKGDALPRSLSEPKALLDAKPAAGAAGAAGEARAAVEQKGAEQKGAEQKATEQKAADQKAADQKARAAADAKAKAAADARAKAADDARSGADPKDGKGADAKAAESRAQGTYALQAGAFASEKTAAEQQDRLRKLGVKTYTEKVKTSQGERIRVRIGPYPNKEAAERARAKLKAAGIDTALIAP